MARYDSYIPDGAHVRARIGLIADTHYPQRCPQLPEVIFEVFEDADLILHAGDIGDLGVVDRLGTIAPVVAVHGNDETHEAQLVFPDKALVNVSSLRILLTHSHLLGDEAAARTERPDDWPTILADRRDLGEASHADVVVFGHLHVPMAVDVGRTLLVNPGIVGHSHVVLRSTLRSVALLLITDNGLHVVHIDLESGQPFEPPVDWDGGYWATMERINESIVDPRLGAWRPFWQTLRDIDKDATWRALLACATECWTGAEHYIVAEAVLAQLRRDDHVDAAVLRDFQRALRTLEADTRTAPSQSLREPGSQG